MGFIDQYRSAADLPRLLKVFPLPGALLLPHAELPLNIFEPRYLAMVSDALAGDRLIGMIQPDIEDADLSGSPALKQVGCAGRISSFAETPDGRILITLSGICRFTIGKEIGSDKPYRQIEADFSGFASDLVDAEDDEAVDRTSLLKVFQDYLAANDMSADWDQVKAASTEALVNTLAVLAPHAPRDKQALLEAKDLKSRADVLIALTEMALARSGSGSVPGLH
ncbi:MAG: peptidase S16 [Alphaproteobacteria bacterium]|nr:MAG: peptidase S16 [Alphaproteobacteria bacterium]TMJ40878.1 MAG: peptidase S16 [Alphaproteobacteria bacterium]